MLRDHLRKTKSKRPQAVDGVLNAPVRSNPVRPSASQRALPGKDTFRTANARRVDGFQRAEGFHPTNQSQSASRERYGMGQSSSGGRQQQQSILHMSLPGGSLHGRKEEPKKKRTKWKTVRRWSLRSAAALSVLVLLAAGFLFAKAYFSANQVFQGGGHAEALSCSTEEDVDPAKLQQEGDGRINILLFGQDNEASLTDSILVASIDPANHTASIVSIPRDLWVTSPNGGSSKINAVYPNAKRAALNQSPDDEAAAEQSGIEALEAVAEEVLGIPVHFYVTIDIAGFEQAVNIVDGVTINVPEELAVSEHMWDDVRETPYFLDVPAGEQHFDPQRALFFVRSRKTSPRGDFDRTERQRLFLQALAQEVLSSDTYTNPVRITQLMDAFSDNVVTNLSVDNAWCLSKVAREIDFANLESISFIDESDPVVTVGMIGNQSIVRPVAGIGDYSEIHSLMRSKLVDGYIAREDARIKVLNGTAIAGQAASAAEELESYGYNVADTGDAPTSDYQQTVLVSLHGDSKPYTQHYLQQRFDVQATANLPEGISIQPEENIDFVLILGSR
jgi:LCP family protein required for cell wall assembly